MRVHDDVRAQMTQQMYIKAIHLLRQQQQSTTLTRLAETLGVAPPTALATIRRLTKAGLVVIGRRKEVRLTDEGESVASVILRRHHLAERLLRDFVGLPWCETHEEACRLEHSISGTVEDRLFAALGSPATCPHGNPIDGQEGPGETATLDQVPAGQQVKIQGINELAEMDRSFLAYLDAHGLIPGAVVEVSRRELSIDILFVRNLDLEFALSLRAASRVRVEPPNEGAA